MLAYASIWPRRFPLLCISPYDCSADSESISLYPKRSASVKPPVSKDLDARIPFKFFRSAKRVHPFLRLLLLLYNYYIINFSVSIVRTLRVYSNIKKRNFYTLYFYTLYLLQLLDYTWFVLSYKTHYVY